MRIGIVTKQMFFDRQEVLAAIDTSAKKVLSKFGAFVRTGARHSIRKAKGASKPGQPPHSHVGLLRDKIVFGYDTEARSVVIGPLPLRSMGTIPPLLEYGGRAVRSVKVGKRRQNKTVTYAPRPFMGPAFEKELPKLPAMWAGSVQ